MSHFFFEAFPKAVIYSRIDNCILSNPGNLSGDLTGHEILEEEDSGDQISYLVTFIFEGVILLFVALVGLLGNFVSFVTIFNQKVQKTFHSLLFLLSIFDTVL